MNSASMNVGLQISVQVPALISLGYVLRSRIPKAKFLYLMLIEYPQSCICELQFLSPSQRLAYRANMFTNYSHHVNPLR